MTGNVAFFCRMNWIAQSCIRRFQLDFEQRNRIEKIKNQHLKIKNQKVFSLCNFTMPSAGKNKNPSLSEAKNADFFPGEGGECLSCMTNAWRWSAGGRVLIFEEMHLFDNRPEMSKKL